jgi:hypothetical protein
MLFGADDHPHLRVISLRLSYRKKLAPKRSDARNRTAARDERSNFDDE